MKLYPICCVFNPKKLKIRAFQQQQNWPVLRENIQPQCTVPTPDQKFRNCFTVGVKLWHAYDFQSRINHHVPIAVVKIYKIC